MGGTTNWYMAAHNSHTHMCRVLQPAQHMPGTFAYAAPELLLGQPCTEKADLFSLGVLLHELITHAVPVRGQMRYAHLLLVDPVPGFHCLWRA